MMPTSHPQSSIVIPLLTGSLVPTPSVASMISLRAASEIPTTDPGSAAIRPAAASAALDMNIDAAHVDRAEATLSKQGVVATPQATGVQSWCAPRSFRSSGNTTGCRCSISSRSGSAVVPDLQNLMQTGSGSERKRTSSVTAPGPNSKKRKINQGSASAQSSSSCEIPLNAPDGSPDWVINALLLLRASNLGPEWDKLINLWLEFEKKSNFEGSEYLTASSRPQAITDWIRRARSPKYPPHNQEYIEIC